MKMFQSGSTIIGRSSDGEEFQGSTSDYYDKPRVDGAKLRDVKDNYFIKSGLNDLQEKLFTGEPQIHYYDQDDNEDPELNRQVERILAKCNLDAKIRKSWRDIFYWGPYLYEPIWGKTDDGWYAPTYLKRLPPESFLEPPKDVSGYTLSEILKGICINKKGEIEFWQLQTDGKPHQLKDVVMLTNPTSDGIAGDSQITTIVPFVSLASFCLKATYQRINRIGAPALFIRFMNTTPQKIGDTSEVELAKLIIRNWGKDNQYMLTKNMELIELKSPDNRSANETLELLDKWIRRYFNPSAMLEKDGPTLGGNAAAQAGMVSTSIQSTLKWLAKKWLPIIEEVFERNGFSGGRVELVLPVPEPDRTETDLKRAVVADRTGVATVNEIREMIQLPEATPELLAEIQERNKIRTASSPNPFGAGSGSGSDNAPSTSIESGGTDITKTITDLTTLKSFQEYYKTFGHDKKHIMTEAEIELAKELEVADKKAAEKIIKSVEKEKGKAQ